MISKPHFQLKKWYFDGVSEEGRAFIGYSATLTWRGLTAQYASYLYLAEDGISRSESRFRDAPLPEIQGDVIRWEDAGLRVRGEWQAAAPAVRAMLHESDAGYLDWHCLQPAARCEIQLGDEPPITGWGYVEYLEMTVPPWEMNFGELRWGRFAHPDSPLVWIELRGSPSRRWVFDGQVLVETATVSDEAIGLAGLNKQLFLYNPTPIEDTQKIMEVVRSLVNWLPGFDHFTPLRFLKARETKWRSRGVLHTPDHADLSEWVIHELVKF